MDDDDIHFCIKCRTVIEGIDNYVKHRKNKCEEGSDSLAQPVVTSSAPLGPATLPPAVLQTPPNTAASVLQTPSNTAASAVLQIPSNTAAAQLLLTPPNTAALVLQTPSNTAAPALQTPSNTAATAVLQIPSNTAAAQLLLTPPNTAAPVLQTPSSTAAPVVLQIPPNTAAQLLQTPPNTAGPVLQTPSNTAAPVVLQIPPNTAAQVITPSNTAPPVLKTTPNAASQSLPSRENTVLLSQSQEDAPLSSSGPVIRVVSEEGSAKAAKEFTHGADTSEKDNTVSDSNNAELPNAEPAQIQRSGQSLEAGQFFQSLELQHRAEETPTKEGDKEEEEKNDNVTFMESIGLYWLNPADNKADPSIQTGGNISTIQTGGNPSSIQSGANPDQSRPDCKTLVVANSELLNNQQGNITLESEDFLQSLQLQHKVECGRTFMESIGLYWLNPADNKAHDEEEHCEEREGQSSAAEEVQEQTSEIQMGEGGMGELDFLAMLGLTRKGGGKRWKLWDPEAAPPITWDPEDDLLCSDMYLGAETAANDPTLMEDQVQRFLQSPVKRKESPELKEGEGKWLPGTQEENTFYCAPCFRTLSSKELWERHCLSEFHFKNSARTDNTNPARTKRDIKKPRFFDEDDDRIENKREKSETKESIKTADELEENAVSASHCNASSSNCGRVGGPRECPSCKAKVDPHQYGKHLISHYHYHRSLGHPDNSSIVLANIGDIVRQAPFQCALCAFYCNWHPEFRRHCSGRGHYSMDSQVEGHYWCNICNWFGQSLVKLEVHLAGEDHGEMVAVINRSVPIVIRKLWLVHCDKCGQAFRLRLSLKNHMKVVHGEKEFQLADHDVYRCKLCSYVSFRKKSLGWHEFLVHPTKKLRFNCYICKKQFQSEKLAKQHRTTRAHREEAEKVKMKNIGALAQNELHSVCRFCGIGFTSFSEKKSHLESVHLKLLPQCTLCGLKFAFPQKLASHVRSKCSPESGIRMDGTFKCEQCAFSSNLQSNVTMHVILKHKAKGEQDESEACPICAKKVSGKNLKRHLLVHGQQFRCEFCYKGFEDEENLGQHRTKEHLNNVGVAVELSCEMCEYKTVKKSLLKLHVKRKHRSAECSPSVCNICGKSFSNKANLKHHSKVHLNQETDVASLTCDFEGCEYKCQFKCDMIRHKKKHDTTKGITCSLCNFCCKRTSELNRHVKIKHSEGSGFKCKQCGYESKNKDHFTRHLKSHESDSEVELFTCQYCKAEFRDKANLKKHILSKHPRRGVYICPEKSCSFEVNSVEEFSDHLSKIHLGSLFLNDFVQRQYIKNFHLKSNLPENDQHIFISGKLSDGGPSFLLCEPPNFVTEQIIEN